MQKNWYAVITADVLYAEDLTPRQKLLMAVIANLSNEKGWCWASNAYFAEIMKCSIPSIQRDLRHLEISGYLGRAMQIGKDGNVEVRALTPISQVTPPHVTGDIPPMSPVTPPHVTGDTYNNKENNKPKNKGNRAVAPSIEDVEFYFVSNGYTKAAAHRAWNYYNAGGWKDSSGKPVINWKQKMIAVWFKDENKDGTTSFRGA